MRLIDFLLFNRSNRLYLDVYGIIELNWRKPGIKWEKVEKFKIANNEMEIRSSKSELLYEVSEEESEQIIEFIKNQKIAVPNSNYNW
ncbi:hypothetical protein [Jejuia spongiicola]|uniref:Uncharacterized protein n=1 Tax=Jejuia spongiicola TaxID=2942207 RepID=A0ABT0QED8_9FLAO|nr:hypothetical protein [Jejuia spongiicola]MCL6295239.1 hypothetical protein [Jejuia spongiicola]